MRPLLFKLEPETAHRVVLSLVAAWPAMFAGTDSPVLKQDLWGMPFSNPVGLAAGLDKDGIAVDAWQALGFGLAEVGTVTASPQPGHPPPRLWRLPEHRALINRLGFPSQGSERVARRLSRLRQRGIGLRLAINLGPNRDTPPERVAEELAQMAHTLAPLADLLVVNLSSPNTAGLRQWQAPNLMRALITQAFPRPWSGARKPPLLIKLAPDLDPSQLALICDLMLDLGVDGVVATNTTIAREAVGVRSPHPGGLSGPPLRELARGVIRTIYRRSAGRLPIIGVGGVASAADAYGHLRAGARLVELYTGLIYEGPGLPRAIKRGLTQLLVRDGFDSVGQAVGIDA
ncbi:MAG TPA: quinone-dependent dihydroorotate dehydrogenase [Candidatus Binataceae bacterium]|nr:quinone-dependent dihydroorotate dehydrogenase [Candidatus Binataceae bacterium]